MQSDVKTAQEFMRRKLVTLTADTNIIDGVARLLKDNISGAPVVDENGGYQGVFSEKCCMNALTDAVEVASEAGMHVERAREFMTSNLVTLTPEIDVFDAIDHILSKRISGAPVLDREGKFQGIFSEKTAMQVLISAAYDYRPGTNVGAYMNTDRNRIISEDSSLLEVAHKFQETPYRRLPVLHGHKLAGQISRRDVLRAEHRLAKEVARKASSGSGDQRMQDASSAQVGKYMDCEAQTITPNVDLLGVAQIFLNSPYRRLPVVQNGKLVGQVSRRDLLSAAADLLRPKTRRHHAESLYISTLSDTRPPSLQ
jgi:CBS domain-containing protein